MSLIIYTISGVFACGAALALLKLARLQSRHAALAEENVVNKTLLSEKLATLGGLEKEKEIQADQLSSLERENSYLKATLEQSKLHHAEQMALLSQAEESLKHTFSSLSSKALQENNSSFLKLAETSLSKFQEGAKGDLDQRQKAISELLSPVKEVLSEVDKKIQGLEKERIGAYHSLKTQVEDLIKTQKDLRTETSHLVQALRAPNVRGRWGEIQLKRVVEIAGMLAHCDFFEQSQMQGEDEKLRPDMVIKLPAGKCIVVDAKTPLSSYLDSLENVDPQARTLHLKSHARQIRTHIQKLSSKAYWDKCPSSPEFVILFLPGESFFSAALEHDPSLIELGAEQKVILATPTTLISLLRAVSYGWRQELINQNAQQISLLGQELYKRLTDLSGHFSKIGKNLGGAVDSYNQTLATFERRVLVSARRFKDLGASHSSQEIDPLSSVEAHPRELVVDK